MKPNSLFRLANANNPGRMSVEDENEDEKDGNEDRGSAG
jgi:hypothetical protein